jgi:tRNA(Ile)-lysidine synthase
MAREARQEFLEQLRRQQRAHWIWTGHQQDDVAETLLMRLARGSGTVGLAAPRPVQRVASGPVCRLRPLLGLRAARIRQELQAAGGRWREDGSNAGKRYLRNRLRQDVLPSWESAAERDAVGGAALSRRLLAEDAEALEQWLAEIGPMAEDGRLNLRALKGKPMALWRRALRQWLSRQSDVGDLSRQGFENLLILAQEGRTRRFSLGKSGYVRIRQGWLFFEQL